MRLGTAKVDITPPVGVELSGFAIRMSPGTAVADRLYARALVMESRGVICGMVSMDILAIGRESVDRVRAQLNSGGIDGSGIMFCASHTHSGPATVMLRNCGRISADYLRHLEDCLVRAVSEAYSECLGCREKYAVEYLEKSVPGFSVNRRDGVDGPIDFTARTLRFRSETGSSAVYLVNYACHGVCMCDTGITGDYISHLCREIEENDGSRGSGGGRTLALFINGPSGDINPLRRDSREEAVKMGKNIGRSVIEAPAGAWAAVDPESLEAASKVVALPFMPPPTRKELAGFIASQAANIDDPDKVGRKVARSMLEWALYVAEKLDEGSLETGEIGEVMAFRIGGVLVVSLPGEIFTTIGMGIRDRLAGIPVLIAAHTNGSVGYVPGPEAYVKGGYETEAYRWYDYPAALAPECSGILADAAVTLAGELLDRRRG